MHFEREHFGGAGITEKRHVGGVTTDLGAGMTEKRHVGRVTTDLGAEMTEKRHVGGVTTDLLDVLIMIEIYFYQIVICYNCYSRLMNLRCDF